MTTSVATSTTSCGRAKSGMKDGWCVGKTHFYHENVTRSHRGCTFSADEYPALFITDENKEVINGVLRSLGHV